MSAVAGYMGLVLVMSSAARDATPEQRQALQEVPDMLRDHSIPVRKILERIFEIRGPDWLPDEQTLNYIRSLKATP